MKVVNLLLDKIIVPILLAFLIPVVTGIGSKASTGNWLEWFASIPNQVWITIGAIIFLWIIIIAIRSRRRQLHKNDSPAISIISVPYNGWIPLGKLPYAGVIWMVRVPKPLIWDIEPQGISPSDIELEIPPRCPKCQTEIEQSRSFWGGYTWKCPKCGFRKRNSDSYYREEERARKIAKRDFEIYQSKAKHGQ